tara:strand:+ start:47 stop:718 length:672 start_codon:yes stop_codon:yes gene_type:complete
MYAQKRTVKKTFCPVCRAAGKDMTVYQSHNIFDGKTLMCPILLSQKCNYCGEVGHTPKYCKSKKCDDKLNRRDVYTSKNENKQTASTSIKITNRFDVLNKASKEKKIPKDKKDKKDKKETKVKQEKKEDMPEIEKGPWSMLFEDDESKKTKEKTDETKVAEGFVSISKLAPVIFKKKTDDVEKMDKIYAKAPKLKRIQKSWADMESDDELFEEDTTCYDDDEW